MIIEIITIILIEIIIILGIYIIMWISNLIFYEEEPPVMYQAELTPEKMEELKKIFDEKEKE